MAERERSGREEEARREAIRAQQQELLDLEAAQRQEVRARPCGDWGGVRE